LPSCHRYTPVPLSQNPRNHPLSAA
jgi:hypothetical protein